MASRIPTPEQAFLAPLARMAARAPDMEALVFWANPGWSDTPNEEQDTGEIAFYAEGLIPEGFALTWRLVAARGETSPDHLRLYVSEAGLAAPDESGWVVLDQGSWPPAA